MNMIKNKKELAMVRQNGILESSREIQVVAKYLLLTGLHRE